MAALGVRLKHATVVETARILVIEDNDSDVFLLNRALKKQDLEFELVHLESGCEAVAFIRRQGAYADTPIPDLILVDLNLSKYTGEDILREIRSSIHLGGIPVCVWSSSRSRRDEALLKDLGVSQFITKPSGLNEFMEIGKTIKDLLAASGYHCKSLCPSAGSSSSGCSPSAPSPFSIA
jgi:chemotaxis family two-component system response regulator Rcp1